MKRKCKSLVKFEKFFQLKSFERNCVSDRVELGEKVKDLNGMLFMNEQEMSIDEKNVSSCF